MDKSEWYGFGIRFLGVVGKQRRTENVRRCLPKTHKNRDTNSCLLDLSSSCSFYS